MLVSTSHNFIFVHIAKNGGGSVRTLLSPYHAGAMGPRTWLTDMMADLPFRQDPRNVRFRPHPNARWARRKFGAEMFDAAFSFAFVRNPWDRAVSRYEFVRQHAKHGQHRRFQSMSFDRFITDEWFRNLLVSRSQLSEVADRNGKILVKKIYRFEAMDEAITDICARIGIARPDILPRENKSVRKSYQSYFTPRTKARFDRIYRQDIERFEYSF